MVHEAMDYANIAMLEEQRVAPVGTIVAANEIGLYENFIGLDACEDKDIGLPMNHLLVSKYTQMALTVTPSHFRRSRKSYDWTIDRAWDLGTNARPESLDTEGARLRYIDSAPVKKSSKSLRVYLLIDLLYKLSFMGESALDKPS